MEEILNLGRDEYERLLKRLTHHALCKMRRLTWRGAYVAHGGAVPGGHEPYDFALDAIEKTLDGVRKWNRKVHKTLEAHLRAAIDSDISSLVNSADNKTGRRIGASAKAETLETYQVEGSEPSPLQVVIDKEWQIRFQEAALKELNGDPFLPKLLECMEAEITAPSEIAQVLETPVNVVNNEIKKLARRLEKLDARVKPTKTRSSK